MKYKIIDRCDPSWSKEFKTKRECRTWIMSGLYGCEGAERDHYVNMLYELEQGLTTLHYN